MLKVAGSCLLLITMAAPALAACGDRGGPGCRLPNGKCAGWAQADYCKAHPEAAEAPTAGLMGGQIINEKPETPAPCPPKRSSGHSTRPGPRHGCTAVGTAPYAQGRRPGVSAEPALDWQFINHVKGFLWELLTGQRVEVNTAVAPIFA
jgi:hypothetical protein